MTVMTFVGVKRWKVSLTETVVRDVDRARDVRDILAIDVAEHEVEPLKRAILECIAMMAVSKPEGTT